MESCANAITNNNYSILTILAIREENCIIVHIEYNDYSHLRIPETTMNFSLPRDQQVFKKILLISLRC